MNTLYNDSDYASILKRLNELSAQSPATWGKMKVSQMLAHCSIALEVASGKRFPKRLLIGYVLGSMLKHKFYNEAPFDKNSPTDPTFVIKEQRDFEKERAHLRLLIQSFHEAGPEGCTTHPHSFFGKLTPEQWGIGMYKHLDHHFRQFGG